jgi:predicted hotdog family 3-hydroxylacyl-ACP dehydratase
MRASTHPVADLLPHAPPMVLLDSVLGWDAGRLDASVAIRPDIPFFQLGKGVPAHVGIEYMAQACGAFAGLEALENGEKVRVGFLLGCRRYLAAVDWFTDGMQLTVRISEVFRDGMMGVFDCTILSDGRELAAAQLNVYQPDDNSLANDKAKKESVGEPRKNE